MLDVDLLSGYSTAKFSFAIKVFILTIMSSRFKMITIHCDQLHAGESFDYAWTVQLKNGAGDLSYIHLLDRFVWLPRIYTHNKQYIITPSETDVAA